jgi:GDP-fucose protein O-fucosyltransferase
MNEIWESYSSSVVLRDFSWSFLVRSAVSRNLPMLKLPSSTASQNSGESVEKSGLIAIHLRRGDYSRHCPRLFTWDSRYISINKHPSLPDKFDPTQFSDSPQLREAYYMTHCLPTVEEIVQRMREVREANPHLKRVYVSTNAWWWFINSLKSALIKDGWEDFMSSLDIVLDSEQRYVSMAVDMAIAEQADVLLGNGVCTYSLVSVSFSLLLTVFSSFQV